MTKFTELPLIDRLAMAIGGGLIVLGTVVLGILELLVGHLAPMYYGYVETEQGREMVTALSRSSLEKQGATDIVAPLVHPNIRATIVVLGLIVLFLYAVYVIAARSGAEAGESVTPSAAD